MRESGRRRSGTALACLLSLPEADARADAQGLVEAAWRPASVRWRHLPLASPHRGTRPAPRAQGRRWGHGGVRGGEQSVRTQERDAVVLPLLALSSTPGVASSPHGERSALKAQGPRPLVRSAAKPPGLFGEGNSSEFLKGLDFVLGPLHRKRPPGPPEKTLPDFPRCARCAFPAAARSEGKAWPPFRPPPPTSEAGPAGCQWCGVRTLAARTQPS